MMSVTARTFSMSTATLKLAKAKKRNGNKPGTPFAEVARELGIKLPARKS
jgi:hypothetical protein